MKKRNNIMQFTDLKFNKVNWQQEIGSDREEKEPDSFFGKPTDEEVKFFRERALSYGDNMVPTIHWDGECWKGFLEHAICEYLADGNMDLAWDYLAIFIYKEFKRTYLKGFEDGKEHAYDY